MEALSREILRVISSPYPTSLRDLSSKLSTCPSEAVLEWADTYPCQITPLAAAILDALSVCPETLEVLQLLGDVRAIRDAILAQNPTILDDLLRSALKDDKSFDKFAPSCVSFLSSPLPPDAPVPLLVSSFFEKCVDEVGGSGSVTTETSVRRVYSLVANGYSYMASLLSSNQAIHLHERLGSLLGSNDQGMVMLSLACLACLVTSEAQAAAEAHVSGLSSGNSTPEPSSTAAGNHRQNPGRQSFFNGSKSVKLLRLVCDNVIASVSKASDSPKTFEILRLSSVIVKGVAEEKKFEFINSSVGKGILKSVLTKIDKLDLPLNVLGLVLDFLHYLTPANVMVPGLQAISEKMLRMARRNEHSIGRYLLPRSYQKYLVSSDSSYLLEALRKAYIAASSPVVSSMAIAKHTDFIEELQDKIDTSSKLRKTIKAALCTNEFYTLLEKLLFSDSNTLTAEGGKTSSMCDASRGKLYKNFRLLLCSIPIRVSLYSGQDNCPQLDLPFVNKLLEKSLSISAEQFECACRYPKRSPTAPILSVVEENSTPSVGIDSRDWRRHLTSELVRNASRQHEILVSSLGEICRDLEARCEDIEKPLRAEKERGDNLVKEVDQWKSKASEAEETIRSAELAFKQECSQKDAEIERLSQQNSSLEINLDHTVSRVEECQLTIQNLEQRVVEAREDTERCKKDADARIDGLMGEHLAQLNEHQESIEELRIQIQHREDEILKVHKGLNNMEAEKIQLERRIRKLDEEAGGLGLELECAKTEVIRKQNSVETLEERIRTYENDLDVRQKAINGLEDDIRNLQDENANLDKTNGLLAAKLEALENEVAEIYLRHEKEIDSIKNEAKAELSKIKGSHIDDADKLQAQIVKLEGDLTSERDTFSKEKKALKAKIKKLEALREQQAKEFSEAQDLSKRLLAVMNGNFASGFPAASVNREGNSQEMEEDTSSDLEEDVEIAPSSKKAAAGVRSQEARSTTRRQTIAAAFPSSINSDNNNANRKSDRRKKSGKGDIINTPARQVDRRHSELPLDPSSSPSHGSPTPKRPRNKSTAARSSLSPKSGKLNFKAKANNNATYGSSSNSNVLPVLSGVAGNKRARNRHRRHHQFEVAEDKENCEPAAAQKLVHSSSTPLTPSRTTMDLDDDGLDSQMVLESSGAHVLNSQPPPSSTYSIPGKTGCTGILDGLGSRDFDDTTLEL